MRTCRKLTTFIDETSFFTKDNASLNEVLKTLIKFQEFLSPTTKIGEGQTRERQASKELQSDIFYALPISKIFISVTITIT